MLKVTTNVELVSSHTYVAYNCEYVDFTDIQGNKVQVRMNAESARQLAKSLSDRYNIWLKDQADKAEKAKIKVEDE